MLGCKSAEDVLSGKLYPRCEGTRLTPNAQQPYELGQVSQRDRRFEGLQGREYLDETVLHTCCGRDVATGSRTQRDLGAQLARALIGRF